MPLKIYDTMKPQGNYPAVDGADVAIVVKTSESMNLANQDGDLLRLCYHVGNRITLGDHDGYRINRVGIRAAAGAPVRFALYDMEQQTEDTGVMTRVAVLGDAVADSEGQAVLDFAGGYEVRRADTIILAIAESAAIHCVSVATGLAVKGAVQFADGDYFTAPDGSQIPYTNGKAQGEGAVFTAMFIRDFELFREQRLNDYIKDAEKRLEKVKETAENALPAVSSLDNGKILCVAGGKWAAAAVADSPVSAFIDNYINDALGGDY